MKDVDQTLPFSRRVTTLAVSNHTFVFGGELAQINFQPLSSIDMVLDFDPRWAAEATKAMVEASWPDAARALLGKQLVTLMTDIQLYGHRTPDQGNNWVTWSAKVRLSPELAEKAMSASGLESMFSRPLDVSSMGGREKFSIVWASRHDEASPARLASILEASSQILGNRGLARSLSGIGLRTPWTKISEARKKLKPEDPRWHGDVIANIDLCDRLMYEARGCPPSATMAEMARAMKEIGWKAIPQRQLVKGATATWWLSSEEATEGLL